MICTSCDRKYPIREDIPVMLIEEGDRFQGVPREELPEVPPPEERQPVATEWQAPALMAENQKLILAFVGLAVGALFVLLLIKLLKGKQSD